MRLAVLSLRCVRVYVGLRSAAPTLLIPNWWCRSCRTVRTCERWLPLKRKRSLIFFFPYPIPNLPLTSPSSSTHLPSCHTPVQGYEVWCWLWCWLPSCPLWPPSLTAAALSSRWTSGLASDRRPPSASSSLWAGKQKPLWKTNVTLMQRHSNPLTLSRFPHRLSFRLPYVTCSYVSSPIQSMGSVHCSRQYLLDPSCPGGSERSAVWLHPVSLKLPGSTYRLSLLPGCVCEEGQWNGDMAHSNGDNIF